MIWFDASLEKPADDDLLRRGIAVILNVDAESVDVIHDITQIADVPVTCFVGSESVDDYSQITSIYHSIDRHPLPIFEAAIQLALFLRRSILLANDKTANPYSFMLISNTGQSSVVLVDPEELDENNRYVVTSHTPDAG